MISDDEWNANIRKTIKDRRPGTTDEEVDLLDSSSAYWGAENYRAAAAWINECLQMIINSDHFHNSIIFIHLNGLFVDIPQYMHDKAKIFSMFGVVDDASAQKFIASNTDVKIREHFNLLWDSSRLIQKIRTMISDDELFMLGFLRHRYCHPILNGYSVKIDGLLGTSKFKVEKWKRLLELGTTTKENEFKETLFEKLKPLKADLETLRDHLTLMAK